MIPSRAPYCLVCHVVTQAAFEQLTGQPTAAARVAFGFIRAHHPEVFS